MTVERKRVTLRVTALVPVEATPTDVRDFVEDSLTWAGGCRRPPGAEGEDDPGDSMFYSFDDVKVTYTRKKRKTK